MTQKEEYAFIKGDRINLVPLNFDHLALYDKWGNDEDFRRYCRFFFPRSTEEVKNWFTASVKSTNYYSFEVWHKEDKKPIGTCNLHCISWINRTAELGTFIGEQDYWGKGLGTEMIILLTKYAFQELNLRKLKAGIFSPNLGSQKAFKKAGYHVEATLKKEVYVDGEYVDIYNHVKYNE
ncbi:GNAT family N-acetyltransferase [Candidatus Lokiarchaeum ossiferum]